MVDLPNYPKCNSGYTYEDESHFICPEYAHEWTLELSTESSSSAKIVKATIMRWSHQYSPEIEKNGHFNKIYNMSYDNLENQGFRIVRKGKVRMNYHKDAKRQLEIAKNEIFP